MTVTTLHRPSATAWRDALPELHAGVVPDDLVAAIDAEPPVVRTAVLDKLERALAAGVCDRATLAVIAEVVTAGPSAAA